MCGHAFVRYADDLNVYVRSQRAGERVMESMRRLYANLKLGVNESKSAVAPATQRTFPKGKPATVPRVLVLDSFPGRQREANRSVTVA